MNSYRVYQVDAFTSNRFEGNPAGVVANADGLSEAQMRMIARELNNSETAFILSPTAADHDVWLRYFTPTTEVPICGHATVAAHFVRALELNLPACTVRQRTGVGVLPVDILPAGSSYRIVMTQGEFSLSDAFPPETEERILAALGLQRGDRDERCPVQIASTGHSKVMVGIGSRETLHALRPDMEALRRASKTIGCNGYFVFTLDSADPEILAHGRMFAPAVGVTEDPVTGNANGPLGAYLLHHHLLTLENGSLTFNGKQGEAMGRPGIVAVTLTVQAGKPVRVQVGGDATLAFKTVLEI